MLQENFEPKSVSLSDGRIICRLAGGLKMFLDGRDSSQTPTLALDGFKDGELSDLVKVLASESRVCVDVGATFGYQTLLMAANCKQPGGRIFAFEPNPRCFTILKSSIEINGFSHFVKVYPQAVGAMSGNGRLLLHHRRCESATLCEVAGKSHNLTESLAVTVLSLDDIMASNRAVPELILISAEGYEPEVWKGMEQTLKATRKLNVLLEVRPSWYQDAAAFSESIFDAGFTIAAIYRNGRKTVHSPPEKLLPSFRSTLLLVR